MRYQLLYNEVIQGIIMKYKKSLMYNIILLYIGIFIIFKLSLEYKKDIYDLYKYIFSGMIIFFISIILYTQIRS